MANLSAFERAVASGEDTSWMADGACVGDTDGNWEPEQGQLHTLAVAHAVAACTACPVRDTCRDFADRTKQAFGIWGGVWRDLTIPHNRRPRRDLRAVA